MGNGLVVHDTYPDNSNLNFNFVLPIYEKSTRLVGPVFLPAIRNEV